MPLEMVLNELSLDNVASSVAEARLRMQDFLETVRQATKRGASRTIRTDRDMNDVLIAPDYTLSRWRNDLVIEREWKQFFLSLSSKLPHLNDLPEIQERADDMDCFHVESRTYGLLAAYLIDGLAVSIRSDEVWDHPLLTIVIEQILGEDIDRIEEKLRHASHRNHIEIHNEWFVDRLRLPEPRDGAELWEQCPQRYPHLRFCTVISEHLRQYRAGMEALKQIMKRLSELDRYAALWTEGQFNQHIIGSKVTPEHSETLNKPDFAAQRTFLCPDGVTRLFSWHARFTPGAGRLYFHPDERTHTVTVGYIGGHLDTVRYQ